MFIKNKNEKWKISIIIMIIKEEEEETRHFKLSVLDNGHKIRVQFTIVVIL